MKGQVLACKCPCSGGPGILELSEIIRCSPASHPCAPRRGLSAHLPLLSRLRFVFGTSVVPALDLVDRQSVTRFVSPSGRTVYQVVGTSGKLYTCYASCHFCSCPAFAFSVLRKGDNLVCKHLLAIYLSRAIGACQEQSVSNQQLTALLLAEEK
ncbi:zinc finger SWIM domain-containing protein 7 isoform 3-T3 [Liasis olivaceus]